ncbi:S1 family peptidase [Streptomyces broussonetiae]|uniref:Trypsin-like serine protease n=1 Tax=Streptomyces broussonetiae TaxID=2686304 RepID=A0A6I6N6N2_9ACTN|nr:S1 family peptidase [Streptomyces broussonetiae]QHA08858.1 trypsin-like serine protease [Streptomyces broussonetiae]
MTQRRTTPTTRALTAASVVVLTAGAALLPGAGSAAAAPASAQAIPSAARAASAAALAARLGDRAAGSYYDAVAHQLVVNITDPSAASQVRSTGAVPRTVRYSTGQLHGVLAALTQRARIAGTAWSIDPRQDKVVVTVDPTVTGAKRTRLNTVINSLGDRVVVRRAASEFKPFIAGGDAIWGSTVRCSLGFNVTVNGAPYFLTAGHCGNASSTWSDSQGGGEVGQTVDSQFPGTDYALVQYDDSSSDHASVVDLYDGGSQQITHAADAYVGESVQRSGSTSGVHGGTVNGLDATVNYEEGTVSGLIDTDVCAEPGDSGGALFDADAAIGLTSGGSGDCTSGGETFFQPVPAALSAEGATLP